MSGCDIFLRDGDVVLLIESPLTFKSKDAAAEWGNATMRGLTLDLVGHVLLNRYIRGVRCEDGTWTGSVRIVWRRAEST